MRGEAETVARVLKGYRSSDGWVASCPCPGHGNKGRGDKRPSLSIKEGDCGKLLVTCHAGCSWEDLKDELDRRGAIARVPGSKLTQARSALSFAQSAPTAVEPNQRAVSLWASSIPVIGTPVQFYLEGRGILERPRTIRCCYQLDDDVGMIAGVQRSDGEMIAAQVKMVTRDGLKALGSRPDTIGHLGDGAVRLGPAAETMGIAEGVETGLSAMAMAQIPVWVALGANRLDSVALPDIVKAVHIFGDNDKAGYAAARRAGEVHQEAGRRVTLQFPPAHLKDFNDLLQDQANRDGGIAA